MPHPPNPPKTPLFVQPRAPYGPRSPIPTPTLYRHFATCRLKHSETYCLSALGEMYGVSAATIRSRLRKRFKW